MLLQVHEEPDLLDDSFCSFYGVFQSSGHVFFFFCRNVNITK